MKNINKKGITIAETMIIIVIMIILLPVFMALKSASVEANLYNEKFNKTYSKWDFFWAGDTIKEFLNGGKQSTHNINIKGEYNE